METAPMLDAANSDNVKSTTDPHRAKDFLDPTEIKLFLNAAKEGRQGIRDYLLFLLMYRHGLRCSEAIDLRRDDISFDRATLWVRRPKGSNSGMHPIEGDELRAIRRYLAARTDDLPWLFISERKTKLTRFAVNYLVERTAKEAGLKNVHPHCLRHSCGYALADKGRDLRTIQEYLGHRSINEDLTACGANSSVGLGMMRTKADARTNDLPCGDNRWSTVRGRIDLWLRLGKRARHHLVGAL